MVAVVTRVCSGSVSCETPLHALTGDRRLDHREAPYPGGGKGLTLSGLLYNPLYMRAMMVARLPFLTTCSDDSKPYMILKGLDESNKNHIGFASI